MTEAIGNFENYAIRALDLPGSAKKYAVLSGEFAKLEVLRFPGKDTEAEQMFFRDWDTGFFEIVPELQRILARRSVDRERWVKDYLSLELTARELELADKQARPKQLGPRAMDLGYLFATLNVLAGVAAMWLDRPAVSVAHFLIAMFVALLAMSREVIRRKHGR